MISLLWKGAVEREEPYAYDTGTVYMLFYKGFKLEREGNVVRMYDIRHGDLYKRVSKYDKELLYEYGLVPAADMLQLKRDTARCAVIDRDLDEVFTQRDQYERNPPKDVKRKVSGCNTRIRALADKYFFYRSRMVQLEKKLESEGIGPEIYTSI